VRKIRFEYSVTLFTNCRFYSSRDAQEPASGVVDFDENAASAQAPHGSGNRVYLHMIRATRLEQAQERRVAAHDDPQADGGPEVWREAENVPAASIHEVTESALTRESTVSYVVPSIEK
jgi:hypothetical protein